MSDLTQEIVERLKLRDSRVKDLEAGIRVERELDSCLSLKILLEIAGERAAEALKALAVVDPTDVKAIVKLQSKVQMARFIADTLNGVVERGESAEQSLRDEETIDLGDNNA